MTEEEKKAIVLLTELRRLYEATAEEYKFRGTLNIQVDEDDSDAIETILNLIEKDQNKIASQEKQIKLMQSCDLAKVIKEQEEKIQSLESQLDFIGEQNKYINKIEKEFYRQKQETKKYKRYFKLAISDLQSEGYMNMPYEEIEEYYSKRKDIV